ELAGLGEFLLRCRRAGLLAQLPTLRFARAQRRAPRDPLRAAASGGRILPAEAVRLYETAPLGELGAAAQQRRRALHPEPVVNYTNVCVTRCKFCNFYRPPGHAEGYVLSREALAEKLSETVAAGGVQILLQGGLHPSLRIGWYEALFRWVKARFPLALHALSPA